MYKRIIPLLIEGFFYICPFILKTNSIMKKLVVIDCCMRAESRTRQILNPVVEALSLRYDVEHIDVASLGLKAVDSVVLDERASG